MLAGLMFYMEVALDLFFMADIYIAFQTGYYDDDAQVLVQDRAQIAKRCVESSCRLICPLVESAYPLLLVIIGSRLSSAMVMYRPVVHLQGCLCIALLFRTAIAAGVSVHFSDIFSLGASGWTCPPLSL